MAEMIQMWNQQAVERVRPWGTPGDGLFR